VVKPKLKTEGPDVR